MRSAAASILPAYEVSKKSARAQGDAPMSAPALACSSWTSRRPMRSVSSRSLRFSFCATRKRPRQRAQRKYQMRRGGPHRTWSPWTLRR
jgi:hypothetical protein